MNFEELKQEITTGRMNESYKPTIIRELLTSDEFSLSVKDIEKSIKRKMPEDADPKRTAKTVFGEVYDDTMNPNQLNIIEKRNGRISLVSGKTLTKPQRFELIHACNRRIIDFEMDEEKFNLLHNKVLEKFGMTDSTFDFKNQSFVESEGGYKIEMRNKSLKALQLENWEKMKETPGQIIETLKKVCKIGWTGKGALLTAPTNGVENGSAKILWTTPQNQIEKLESDLFDFFKGGSSEPLELGIRFQKLLDEWPKGILNQLMAFFCFLINSEYYVPFRPSEFGNLMRYYGIKESISGKVSWERYSLVLEFINVLKDKFSSQNPTSLDVQGYLWTSATLIPELTPVRYWAVRPGSDGSDWHNQREKRLIGISYGLKKPLSLFYNENGRLIEKKKLEHALIDSGFTDGYEGSSKQGKLDQAIISYNYLMQIKPEDKIVALQGFDKILGVGTVTGKYEFRNGDYPHTVPVDWYFTDETRLSKPFLNTPGTIFQIKKSEKNEELFSILFDTKGMPSNKNELIEILKWKKNVILYGPPGTGKTWTCEQIQKEYEVKPKIALLLPSKPTGSETDKQKLERQQNDISEYEYVLWGLWQVTKEKIEAMSFPIVGYLCAHGKIIATANIVEIIPSDQVNSDEEVDTEKYNNFAKIDKITKCDPSFPDAQLRMWKDNSIVDSKFNTNFSYVKELDTPKVKFVTFHPSYSYEDFIEGIRPVIQKSNSSDETYTKEEPDVQIKIAYELQEGIFKKICDDAAKDPDGRDHLLIIDEVNRGNIPKIFGELITLIEDNKRNKLSINLAYSKDPFTVPENLHILGTMNTADKSLIEIDSALRRRFAFYELMPNSKLVKSKVDEVSLEKLLDALNQKIRDKDQRDKQIGHSYFMEKDDIPLTPKDLQRIFKYEIIPLLQDYFYQDYDVLQDILGGRIVSKTKMVVNEKFIDGWVGFKKELIKIIEKMQQTEEEIEREEKTKHEEETEPEKSTD